MSLRMMVERRNNTQARYPTGWAGFWLGWIAWMILASWPLERALAAPDATTAPPLAQSKKLKPAKLKISGGGFVKDLQLRKLILTLALNGKQPEVFDANLVEDAALI